MGPPPGPPPASKHRASTSQPHNHVHLQAKYIKPTESGLPPDAFAGPSMEIPDPKMLSRSELAAAIIDMHAAVSQKNVEIDHLKSEAKVLKRILEEKGEGVEWGAVDEGHGRGERKQTESKSVFFS